MPRGASVRPDDDDDEPEENEEEIDDEEEEEEPRPRRRGRSPPKRTYRHPRQPPVRRWRASEHDEEEAEEDEEEGAPAARRLPPSGKKPVYWRARDSLFFEPLVALAIIVVLLVSLFAYTQNWPPVYVVESPSMQHGTSDQLGLINTGDMVLAQKVSLSAITSYETGSQTGYSTYGEYGDVILYSPDGQGGSTPIIHRAILYLEWNPSGHSYNATELAGLPCGNASTEAWAYIPPHQPATCDTTTGLTGTLQLYHVGWRSVNISIPLTASVLGAHSGYLTMGDNNTVTDQLNPPPISSLVEPGWIIGVARGMIPWFGAVKLLLEGNAGSVPPQSWEFMGLTIVAVILIAFGIHYAFRREGIETPLRKEEEEKAREEAEARAEAAPAESAPRGWLTRLRRRRSEDEEEEPAEEKRRTRRTRPPPSHAPAGRGRPAPHVRRGEKPPKKRDSDDEL
jgi:signal peptidase